MNESKLVLALKFAEKLSRKRNQFKKEFQELISVLLEAIHEIEGRLEGHINSTHRTKLKLCLLQLRYTINKMSDVLSDSSYSKKTIILKLLNKKIYLCLKGAVSLFNEEPPAVIAASQEANYHCLMSQVLTALLSSQIPDDLSDSVDSLLCSCLTIAKLSIGTDFQEINASCRSILDVFTSIKDQTISKQSEDIANVDHMTYNIKLLERKVNTAMLRLFLQIMCYPQASLKALVKKSGASVKSEKFSEDLDDEISDFDLTCDRIALICNFAIKSCEQESLKLKVQNSLANLEFCEESLVPACIDFYLDPNQEKRELLKFLSSEWKAEVLHVNGLLDSIVDPAAFSLVVFEDLYDLVQELKADSNANKEMLFQQFYQRCFKLTENVGKSPDCISDSFLDNLKKSLASALKTNENKNNQKDSSLNRVQHLEVILSLVDQISEHLNKILNHSLSFKTESVSFSTLKDVSFKDSTNFNSGSNQQDISYISKEWDNRCRGKENIVNYNRNASVPSRYLEKAQLGSPYVFTMYQKTPVRKKLKDNLTLTLDLSKQLGLSFEA